MHLPTARARTALSMLLLVLTAACGGGGGGGSPPPPDSTPNSFAFSAQIDVAPGTVITSPAITITGINTATSISISAGEYSIAGGAFTSASGMINNQQSLRVRITAPASTNTSTTVTVTVGGMSADFVVTTVADTTPDAIGFGEQAGVAPGAVVESATVSVAGLDLPVSVSISGGEYSIDGGMFTSAPGTIDNGQSIALRVTASASTNTSTTATVTIGALSADFVVTTIADTTPDPIVFSELVDVTPGAVVDSAAVAITGIDIPASISITGGEYAIDGGSFTSASGMIDNLQSLVLRVTASAETNTATSATVTVGGVDGEFVVTTIPDTTPDGVDFGDQTDVIPGTAVDSATVAIAGIDVPVDVSISGGEYAIDGGAFTSAAGTISAGQSIVVRVVASDMTGTTVAANVVLGSLATSFTVTTLFDTTAPVPVVHFPPLQSRTSADTITIRGTAADDWNSVTAVRLNGIDVTTSDDFATWSATISLSMGPNEFTIETEDSKGNVDSTALVGNVTRNFRFGLPAGIAYDEANNRVLAIDTAAGALVSIDLTTQFVDIVSDNARPGPDFYFGAARSVVLDPEPMNNRAFVLDPFQGAVLAVDLTTGARTTFSDSSTPDSVNPWSSLQDMTLDAVNSRLLVIDSAAPGTGPTIFAVSLTDGSRTILSDPTTPDANYAFTSPQAIAVDAVGNRALVTNYIPNVIYAVDLTNGERTVFSGESGDNPLDFTPAIVVDENNSRALVTQPSSQSILAVSLVDGARTILTDPAIEPQTADLDDPWALAMDPTGNQVLVMDRDYRQLYGVDLTNGAKTKLSSDETGNAGFGIREPRGVMLDTAGSRLLVTTDEVTSNVLAIDLDTAQRTLFSSGTIPNTENPFLSAAEIVPDFTSNRAFVLDKGQTGVVAPSIKAVDLVAGARTIVTSGTFPDAMNPLQVPLAMAYDETNSRLLVSDSAITGVFDVDVGTGERSVFSNDSMPDNVNPFSTPNGIVIDTTNTRALIANNDFSFSSSLLSVDLISGAREILSDATTPGPENPFVAPRSLALDADNNRVFLMDQLRDEFLAVDITTGARTMISHNFAPFADNPFGSPSSVAYDPVKQVAYVVNEEFDAVLVVDVTTGKRAYLLR